MKNHYNRGRSSGILVHITSLPSRFGIGDIGPSAHDFLYFLHRSGQSIWQFLPLGPTDPVFDNSPYMTVSAFAGNPLLISPDLLYQSGLLLHEDLAGYEEQSPYSVHFPTVIDSKRKLLAKAFTIFSATQNKDPQYQQFLNQTLWLDDYCLFTALKKRQPGKAWYQWDSELARRTPTVLQYFSTELYESIEYFRFEQYVFYQQWQQLHELAKSFDITLFGDIPIYVSLDSVDVWANQDIFQLDAETLVPTHISGVPPDYFSETGQKWGNPLYRWNSRDKKVSQKLNAWWTERFKSVFTFVDMARIDHFRGFESYWSIPAEEKTAINGTWQKGPGKRFFDHISANLGPLHIVAEDLGDISKEVIALRNDLSFPGMKVLQFAFDGNKNNSFLPYNFESSNFLVYTGTHDNDTTVGWFLDGRITDSVRESIKNMANRELHDAHGIHRDLIYLALSSVAAICIFPLQDVLGFGSDCRMNTPGTEKGNWTWRCSAEFLTNETADWLHKKTAIFGRLKTLSHKNRDTLDHDSETKS